MSSWETDGKKDGSIRYVLLTGIGSDFMEWKVKTLSLARRKGFQKYLTDVRDWTDKEHESRNADAWDQVALSLTGAPFNSILEANGDANKA